MAKGLQKQKEYQQALSLLGKSLLRRSKRRCELTDQTGELIVFDLDPPKGEPNLGHVLHVSPQAARWLEGEAINPFEARHLEAAVWSEYPAVARAALQLLQRIDEPWAREAAESAQMMNEL